MKQVMRRGWNFASPGHGDVDFDKIIRVLNEGNYQGPLFVEWEDSGMEEYLVLQKHVNL